MAAACVILQTPLEASLHAYLYAWVENQVLAALKAVPLGQSGGQRVLAALTAVLPAVIDAAQTLARQGEGARQNFAPMLAIASSRHEAQYSRLFRS